MRTRLVAPWGFALVCTSAVLLGGCSSGAASDTASAARQGQATGSPVPADVAAVNAAAAATGGASPAVAPDSLAPAGPAPGGVVVEEESGEPSSASKIADSIACVEMESQEHQPSVEEQTSCRRGVDRVYISTFTTAANRDTYLREGPQVVPGGWNVVGENWVVHVESESTANEVQAQLQGSVQPGA